MLHRVPPDATAATAATPQAAPANTLPLLLHLLATSGTRFSSHRRSASQFHNCRENNRHSLLPPTLKASHHGPTEAHVPKKQQQTVFSSPHRCFLLSTINGPSAAHLQHVSLCERQPRCNPLTSPTRQISQELPISLSDNALRLNQANQKLPHPDMPKVFGPPFAFLLPRQTTCG